MIEIKLLGTDCARCKQLDALLKETLSEADAPAVDLEEVSDLGVIASFGVLAVPALVVNGEVKSVGNVPSKAELKSWLQQAQKGD
jgi:small redox-active disulfide protein 2